MAKRMWFFHAEGMAGAWRIMALCAGALVAASCAITGPGALPGSPPGSGSGLVAVDAAKALAIPGDGAGLCQPSTDSSGASLGGGKVPVDVIGVPVIEKGVQVLEVRVDAQGYTPAAFVVQKGMKAIVRFKAVALDSCNNPVVFPEYNGGLDLEKGQLETPELTVTEDFTFQCGMAMLHGYVKAVDDLAKVDMAKVRAEIGAWVPADGAGCCGG